MTTNNFIVMSSLTTVKAEVKWFRGLYGPNYASYNKKIFSFTYNLDFKRFNLA